MTIPTATVSSSQPGTSAGASSSLSAPAPQGTSALSGSAAPFDSNATTAGFAGPYRFVAHLSGLPGLTELGGVVQGQVTDPEHFRLDFPESSFITHYTRDGSTARAMVNGQTVVVRPGEATAGTISPEDLLPAGLWGQVIALWEGTLQPAGTVGRYAASTGVLTSKAREDGLLASDWQLSAKTDAAGRLTTVAFSGRSWDQVFALDLVMLYG